MSSKAEHAQIVDVAIGIVVDNMSPANVRHHPLKHAQDTDTAPKNVPRILITQRKAEQVLGGYWELPGGKLEPNESPADAVVRELHEEVGIYVVPIDSLDTVEHCYDHAHVRLIPFICKHVAGEPRPLQVDQVRWVTPDTLADYTFPEASLPILDELLRWLNRHDRPTST